MEAKDLTPTVEELLQEMATALMGVETCPYHKENGWFSLLDLMEKTGLTDNQVSVRVKQLVTEGKWVREKWRQKCFYKAK